jgi:hypothetical protein
MHTLIARIALRYVIPIVDDDIVIGNICVCVEETYITSYTDTYIISRILSFGKVIYVYIQINN